MNKLAWKPTEITANKSRATASSEQTNGWSVIDKIKFIAKKACGPYQHKIQTKLEEQNSPLSNSIRER